MGSKPRAMREDRFVVLTPAELGRMQVRIQASKAAVMSPKGSIRFYPKRGAAKAAKKLTESYKKSQREERLPLIREAAEDMGRHRPEWADARYVVAWHRVPKDRSHVIAIIYEGFSNKRKALARAKSVVNSGKATRAGVYTGFAPGHNVYDGELVEGYYR